MSFREFMNNRESSLKNNTIKQKSYVFSPVFDELKKYDVIQNNSENGRTYSIGDYEYPSVTTVLSKTKPEDAKQALLNWKKRVGENESVIITQQATDRGTILHKVCEDYILGNTPAYSPLFRQIQPFLQYVDNIHALESRLFSHKLKIAGSVDCVAEYDNKLSVIDFKNSLRYKESWMIEDYFIQTTLYSLMFGEMTNKRIEQIVILMAIHGSDSGLIFIKKPSEYLDRALKRVYDYYKMNEMDGCPSGLRN